MDIALETGCMFVLEGFLLPPALRFESQPYSDGWRLVRGLRSQEIDRQARDCGWSLVSRGSSMRRTAIGLARAGSLQRATSYLLGETRKNAFNAMEITRITSRRFLGLYMVGVSAHSRSLQKGFRWNALPAVREVAEAPRIPTAERF